MNNVLEPDLAYSSTVVERSDDRSWRGTFPARLRFEQDFHKHSVVDVVAGGSENPRDTVAWPDRRKESKEPNILFSRGVVRDSRCTCKEDKMHASEVLRCFRCNRPGHFARECRESRSLKCFGCGQEGVTRKNCTSCSGNEFQDRV